MDTLEQVSELVFIDTDNHNTTQVCPFDFCSYE